MPNYVSNHVTFIGESEHLEQLKTKLFTIKQQPEHCHSTDTLFMVDFNKLIPMPKSLNLPDSSILENSCNLLTLNRQLRFIALEKELGEQEMTHYCQQLSPFLNIDRATLNQVIDLLESNQTLQTNCGLNLKLGETALINEHLFGYRTRSEWCLMNWGTKANAITQSIGDITNEARWSVAFDTVESVPELYFEALSAACPEIFITVRYADEGLNFAGTLELFDGCLNDYPCPSLDYMAFTAEHFAWTS